MDNKKDNLNKLLDDIASKEVVIENRRVRIVEEPEQDKQKNRFKNRLILSLLILLVLSAFGWFIGGTFMNKINFGDTRISSRSSDEAIKSLISQKVDNYKLTIAYPDGSKKDYSLEEMGLIVDYDSTIASIREKQHSFSNRVKWWHLINVNLKLGGNKEKRDSFIADKATQTIQPAIDATLSIKDGEVVVTNSTPGKHYGLNAPVSTINNAVSILQEKPLKLETLSKRPAITSKQLIPYQEKLKNMLKQSVVFNIQSNKFKATTNDISKWIEVTLNENGKKIDVTVNSGNVLSYINKIAAPFIQPSKARVVFTREDGTKAVLFKGSEGTDVVGKSKIATKVATNLLENKAIEETFKIDHADSKTVNAKSYDKWIEVDLTKKRMYAYKQSSTIKTFLISAGAPATPTVTGQYNIYAKVVQQDMRGLNVDGSSYFQPNVSWVNYFYQDYAIHGNYWRPLSWFGNVNSSHGCVGLVNSEAQWIFSWAPVGTPIIIHY